VADIVSQRREKRITLPRQVAMYLSRTVAAASYPSIAEKFGGRDHSTVMHAVKVIEGKRYADAGLGRSISAIEGQLKAGAA
jgi:chromosomal replication initiator protein